MEETERSEKEEKVVADVVAEEEEMGETRQERKGTVIEQGRYRGHGEERGRRGK